MESLEQEIPENDFLNVTGDDGDIYRVPTMVLVYDGNEHLSFDAEYIMDATGALRHPSAYVAYTANVGARSKVGHEAEVHKNAMVGNKSDIESGSKILSYATIGHFAIVGCNSLIGECAHVENWTVVGENAKIGYRASVRDYASVGRSGVVDDVAELGSREALRENQRRHRRSSDHINGHW